MYVLLIFSLTHLSFASSNSTFLTLLCQSDILPTLKSSLSLKMSSDPSTSSTSLLVVLADDLLRGHAGVFAK